MDTSNIKATEAIEVEVALMQEKKVDGQLNRRMQFLLGETTHLPSKSSVERTDLKHYAEEVLE